MTKTTKGRTQSPVNPQGFGRLHDVSKLCRVTDRTVKEWIKTRKIPFIKVGGRLLFDMDELKRHLRERCHFKPVERL